MQTFKKMNQYFYVFYLHVCTLHACRACGCQKEGGEDFPRIELSTMRVLGPELRSPEARAASSPSG